MVWLIAAWVVGACLVWGVFYVADRASNDGEEEN